ncbi:adipocyte plasma membrane-associated protein-like, partial [Lingula anatina]|uniref:Adipocyte plasma membrane-associated protein-like n=1 Tax=Lingula anatina TaxID=7574 RepID=A0A1S3IE69_LINAN
LGYTVIFLTGKLFTGTADGKILEINGDDIRVVATLGKPPCGKFDDEPTCGRPLGMRFDKDGSLVVVDAYLGLFRVNVETGKFVQLYSPETLVDGEQAAFLNDLDIDSDGTVYFTDSSTNWGRRYNRYAAMEAKKNGRLLAYNPNTKQTEVILKNMSFPNGVQLSPEKDFILIAELCTCKILQYHTKGPRKGEVEIFSDNLPGAPDNIRPSSSGGYWVGLATTRRAGKFSLLDYTSTKPWMKKLIFKVFGMKMRNVF